MKLLTINTHSLAEENYGQKLEWFVDVIVKEKPDVIAMQEVNQSMDAPLADPAKLRGYFPCTGMTVPVRRDNHAAQVADRLRWAGETYSWTWLAGKVGYGKYDEGMAFLCRNASIVETDVLRISTSEDYTNWRTRKVLGIRNDRDDSWYYTVHMGWWNDEFEPFQKQWERLETHLQTRKEQGTVWLMGDFNSPAEIRGQGYDRVSQYGWQDTYHLAAHKDSGITVEGIIDGWRELLDEKSAQAAGMRIDQIWCSKEAPVRRSRVIFNGEETPVISDHYGVMIYTSEE